MKGDKTKEKKRKANSNLRKQQRQPMGKTGSDGKVADISSNASVNMRKRNSDGSKRITANKANAKVDRKNTARTVNNALLGTRNSGIRGAVNKVRGNRTRKGPNSNKLGLPTKQLSGKKMLGYKPSPGNSKEVEYEQDTTRKPAQNLEYKVDGPDDYTPGEVTQEFLAGNNQQDATNWTGSKNYTQAADGAIHVKGMPATEDTGKPKPIIKARNRVTKKEFKQNRKVAKTQAKDSDTLAKRKSKAKSKEAKRIRKSIR